MTESKELIPLESIEIVKIFNDVKSWENLFLKIKNQVEGIVPDVSTKKGRDEIISRAAWVTKSKTYLNKERKRLTKEKREEIKNINGLWEKVEFDLSGLSEKTREPVTLYQAEEDRKKALDDERIEKIKENIESIENHCPSNSFGVPILVNMATTEQLRTATEELAGIAISKEFFEEFFEKAGKAKTFRLEELQVAHDLQKGKDDLADAQKKLADAQKKLEADKKILEDARVAKIELKIDDIRECEWIGSWKNADSVERKIEKLEKISVDSSFEEFEPEAGEIKRKLLEDLKAGFVLAEESDKKEFEKETEKTLERTNSSTIRFKKVQNPAVERKLTPDEIKAAEALENKKKKHREIIACYQESGYSFQESVKLMKLLIAGKIKNISIHY